MIKPWTKTRTTPLGNFRVFTVRADQKISDKDSLFGTYSFDNSPLTQPDTLGNVLQHAIARRQISPSNI